MHKCLLGYWLDYNSITQFESRNNNSLIIKWAPFVQNLKIIS